jgi:hypothetical protein
MSSQSTAKKRSDRNLNVKKVPHEFLNYLTNGNFSDGVERIELKGSIFDYVINVPSDGWCLLYSFQIGYYPVFRTKVTLEHIRTRLFESFKEFSENETTKYFLNFINEEDEYNSSLNLTGHIFISNNPAQLSTFINKYHLISYLHGKVFNSDIVNLLPKLLADIFGCIINVFQIERNIFVLKKENVIFPILCRDQRYNMLSVNLLYLKELNHYMVFSDTKFSTDFLNEMKNEIRNLNDDKLLDWLIKDDFYNSVALNYKSSNFTL